MSLLARIEKDVVTAMKSRDSFKVGVLRLAKAALANKRIELRTDLTAEQENQVVSTLVKQRNEAIEIYEKAGRNDLAEKEGKEREILQSYLPEEVSDAEIEAAVQEAIESVGATSAKDIGGVMKEALAKLKATGKTVDGKRVNGVVRARLS